MPIPLAKDNETLRDEIAIAAMKKLVTYKNTIDAWGTTDKIKNIAKTSYEIADAMLEARKL
jgi:hypothetical protein